MCLNWLISISCPLLLSNMFSFIMFCFTNFLSSRIRISFNLYSFSFYLKINIFLYYSCLLVWSYPSITRILSCHTFSPSLFSFSNCFISFYNSAIISLEIVSLLGWLVFLLFVFYFYFPFSLFAAILASSSRTLPLLTT